MWHMHAVEHFYIIKTKEVLIDITTWIRLERLNEISHAQEDDIMWFHLHEISKIDKFIGTESKLKITRDREDKECEAIT